MRENGVVTGYKKDIEGNVVVTKADPQMLSEIAQATSGDYMDGTSTEAVVDRITDLLGKGPKTTTAKRRSSNTRTATSGLPALPCCCWCWIRCWASDAAVY